MRLLTACIILSTARLVMAQAPRPCDSNADGVVTIDEIISAVNGALNGCPVTCVGDLDGNGSVTIDEVVTCVNAALADGPPQPTPPAFPSQGECPHGFNENTPPADVCIFEGTDVTKFLCLPAGISDSAFFERFIGSDGLPVLGAELVNVGALFLADAEAATHGNASLIAWAPSNSPSDVHPISGGMTLTKGNDGKSKLLIAPITLFVNNCIFWKFTGRFVGTRSMHELTRARDALRRALGIMRKAMSVIHDG